MIRSWWWVLVTLCAAAVAPATVAHAAAPPFQVPDTIAQRVQACTLCHGKEGRATNEGYFPRIAGKPAGYLYNQLINFREGRRSNATMTYLVEHLSDAYLLEIAGYFSALDLPYPPPPPPATPVIKQELARGDALVHQGDAARGIPACIACHGALLTGAVPAIPGLLGLPRDYLAAQFGGWRTGQRKAASPDCMARITAMLTPDDVSAVATWLATQAVPSHAKPALTVALPLPIPCGSVGL